MSKLTLPITVGRLYTRRDGTIVVVTQVTEPLAYYNINGVHSKVNCYAKSGFAGSLKGIPEDLVADYIGPVVAVKATAHVHAASMLLYAQDAAETAKPWERWEYRKWSGGLWYSFTEGEPPKWAPFRQYQRKTSALAPVFIEINGHQVPEPMRVAPYPGGAYWEIIFATEILVKLDYWEGDAFNYENLLRGFCHLTKEAAELHARALISFTKL